MRFSKREKRLAQDIWNGIEIDIVPASTCCGDNYNEDVISVDCLKRVFEFYGVDFDYYLKDDCRHKRIRKRRKKTVINNNDGNVVNADQMQQAIFKGLEKGLKKKPKKFKLTKKGKQLLRKITEENNND